MTDSVTYEVVLIGIVSFLSDLLFNYFVNSSRQQSTFLQMLKQNRNSLCFILTLLTIFIFHYPQSEFSILMGIYCGINYNTLKMVRREKELYYTIIPVFVILSVLYAFFPSNCLHRIIGAIIFFFSCVLGIFQDRIDELILSIPVFISSLTIKTDKLRKYLSKKINKHPRHKYVRLLEQT